MNLSRFDNSSFDRGRPAWVEALWLLAQAGVVCSWLPGSRHRVALLGLFGARIGEGAIIKPGVRVKFPWRLVVGDHTWLGEDVWIDNLAPVTIGSHCCISQGAYFCTGSHDWSRERFDLIVKPIAVADHVWIGARATVAPGVNVGEGAVLSLGSVATSDLAPWCIHAGVPASNKRPRKMESTNDERPARWTHPEDMPVHDRVAKDKHMTGNWELSSLPVPARFFAYADAYIRASGAVCKAMTDDQQERSWPNACVAMMLGAHAVELFLKGAILVRNSSKMPDRSHKLAQLKAIYDDVYPEPEFIWDIPFQTEHLGMAEEEAAALKKDEPVPSIMYRYPVDGVGAEWKGIHGFTPNGFLTIVETVNQDFRRLRTLLHDI